MNKTVKSRLKKKIYTILYETNIKAELKEMNKISRDIVNLIDTYTLDVQAEVNKKDMVIRTLRKQLSQPKL